MRLISRATSAAGRFRINAPLLAATLMALPSMAQPGLVVFNSAVPVRDARLPMGVGGGSGTRSDVCEYAVDDGTVDSAVGTNGPATFVWLNAFDAQGGCQQITQVYVVWSSSGSPAPANGSVAHVYIWEDPNDDGDPTDAVLVRAQAVTVQDASTGNGVFYTIPATSVSGRFFVGASAEIGFDITYPGALDNTTPVLSPPVSWFYIAYGGPFDATSLAGASLLIDQDIPGEWVIRASAGGSGFTYQGMLEDAGEPVNGTIDISFELFTSSTGGTPIESTLLTGVSVEDGLFSTLVEFDASLFDGTDRWLGIWIANPAGSALVPLAGRQRVSPTPMAMYALQATEAAVADVATSYSGNLPWSNLTGVPAGFADGIDNTGGDGHSLDAADGSPTNAVFVDNDGQVGIRTISPAADLHVVAQPGSETGLLITPQAVGSGVARVTLAEDPAATSNMQAEFDGALNRLAIYGQTSSTRVGPWMTIWQANGRTGVNLSATPSAQLHVRAVSLAPLALDRTNSDGTLVDFRRDGVSIGVISVAGGVITYGAFTGVHFADADDSLPRGTLVRLTGNNGRVSEEPMSEMIYGVQPTSMPNDPAVLGAYLADATIGESERDTVMSVGNGEIWVVQTGADITPGDLLISSDIEGCAMLDDPARFTIGHVVARAAEPVNWASIAPGADGTRRALVSVLFDRFVRPADTQTLERRVESLDAENRALRIRLDALEAAIRNGGTR